MCTRDPLEDSWPNNSPLSLSRGIGDSRPPRVEISGSVAPCLLCCPGVPLMTGEALLVGMMQGDKGIHLLIIIRSRLTGAHL